MVTNTQAANRLLSVGGTWLQMLSRHQNRQTYVIREGPPMQRGGFLFLFFNSIKDYEAQKFKATHYGALVHLHYSHSED